MISNGLQRYGRICICNGKAAYLCTRIHTAHIDLKSSCFPNHCFIDAITITISIRQLVALISILQKYIFTCHWSDVMLQFHLYRSSFDWNVYCTSISNSQVLPCFSIDSKGNVIGLGFYRHYHFIVACTRFCSRKIFLFPS